MTALRETAGAINPYQDEGVTVCDRTGRRSLE
jgi:hypothetical protein